MDDDEAVRESLRLLLQSEGLDVEAYDSAEAFLADCDVRRVGCRVLDLRLPGMSGLDLLEFLEVWANRPPTIVITGHAPEEIVERARNLGIADFFRKPFRDDAFLLRVRQVIEADGQPWQHDARRGGPARSQAPIVPQGRPPTDTDRRGRSSRGPSVRRPDAADRS